MKHPTLLLVLTLAGFLPRVQGQPENADPWLAVSQYRFTEAHALFVEALREQPGDRALRLGEAVAMLNQAPRTAATIQQAAHALQVLVAEQGADEVGVTARYVLARIAGIHRAGFSPADAAPELRALLNDTPQHPLAQHAGVKLCLLLLYERDLSPEPDFAAAEAVLARLTLPGPRRDGHLALGRAYLYFRKNPSQAFAHLQAAYALGLQSVTTAASIGLSIAELATELNEPAVAREHYTRFLRDNPRDVRAQLVRDRLAALPAPTPGGTAP